VIIVRFRVECRPEKTEEIAEALRAVIAPSRALDGVISFDIARDLADPNAFIATEVYDGRTTLDRQEALPEVRAVLAMIEAAVAAEPEATIFHVSSTESFAE
jgi:quinol monooxygenase YgiN